VAGTRRAGSEVSTGSDPVGTLLVRARTDPEAFGELYDELLPTILGWLLRRTRSAHVAMELTAETFAQALGGLGRFDPAKGPGTGWVLGIAANQHHRYVRTGQIDRRHRGRLQISGPLAAPDELEQVIDLVDAQALVPQLEAALDELSDGLRAAVELRVGHDLPYVEVARRLGCSVGSARTRVARGLRELALAMVAR
jgi:RNA polymerase sigma factor (sigma-70 family)